MSAGRRPRPGSRPGRAAHATTLLLAGLLAGAAGASRVAGQTPDSVAVRTILSGVRPRTLLRFELRSGQRVTAPLLAPGDSDAVLGGPAATGTRVAYADVSRPWQQRRSPGIGAIIGGGSSAVFGAFLGALAYGLCEDGCHHSQAGAVTTGALFVGAAGAGVGALIGAGIPHWKLRYQRRGDGARPEAAGRLPAASRDRDVVLRRGSRHLGEVTVLARAGYGGFPDASGPGSYVDERGMLAGATAGIALRAGRLTVGPEVGVLRGDPGLLTLGGVIRVDLARPPSAVVPYIVAGLAAHNWHGAAIDSRLLAGTLGAGATLGGWRVEGTWHRVLQNDVAARPSLALVAVGRRILL